MALRIRPPKCSPRSTSASAVSSTGRTLPAKSRLTGRTTCSAVSRNDCAALPGSEAETVATLASISVRMRSAVACQSSSIRVRTRSRARRAACCSEASSCSRRRCSVTDPTTAFTTRSAVEKPMMDAGRRCDQSMPSVTPVASNMNATATARMALNPTKVPTTRTGWKDVPADLSQVARASHNIANSRSSAVTEMPIRTPASPARSGFDKNMLGTAYTAMSRKPPGDTTAVVAQYGTARVVTAAQGHPRQRCRVAPPGPGG